MVLYLYFSLFYVGRVKVRRLPSSNDPHVTKPELINRVFTDKMTNQPWGPGSEVVIRGPRVIRTNRRVPSITLVLVERVSTQTLEVPLFVPLNLRIIRFPLYFNRYERVFINIET